MKIINEIEKSRLNEENMHQINGGDGEACNPYVTCEPVNNQTYQVSTCVTKVVCPKDYLLCLSPGSSTKWSCSSGYWEPHF
jgi:hypothetical protein